MHFLMIRKSIIYLVCLLSIGACTTKKEISDWRGPNRDGIYHESGLLKQWPEEGPELLWSVEGLGFGYNSVAVAGSRIYVTGVKDSAQSVGTLSALDLNGMLLWEKVYGQEFVAFLFATRSTPVVADGLIYIESGNGAVYCLDTETGDKVWSKDFIEDFGVDSVIQFGYAESVLIDGDHLICVPGGKENNVVALNRFTGEKIWVSPGNGEKATYNSPILVRMDDHRLVIAMTAASIMGIDAETGEMYWRIEHTQGNNIHANTPIFADGKAVVTSVDPTNTSGMVQIQLLDDGKNAKVLWRNKKLRSFMGGIIKIDTCLYGSAYLRNDWQVIDWNTGEMLVQNKELGGGSMIYADGMFYCYSEQTGEIALVNAGPDKFEFVSRFKVPLGTREHWAHPVIDKGVLYIRHGDALMAYDIKAS